MGKFVPFAPIDSVINLFVSQAKMQLIANMRTQRVWPTEVYAGYSAVNEKRRVFGQWNSTGAGIRSIMAHVTASQPDRVAVMFTLNDYLRYVDLGVGQGTKADDVDRARKAYYTRRYITSWKRSDSRSHRPYLMMEIRHLQRRIQEYLTNYYGYQGEMWIGNITDDGNGNVTVKEMK